MSAVTVLLSLGSNLSYERATAIIHQIRSLLPAFFEEIRFSSVYRTPNEGKSGLEPYTNCVAVGKTVLSLEELEAKFKSIEVRFGRTPATRSTGIVPIDIDLVQYGSEIVRLRNLEMNYMKIGMAELERS